MKALLTAGLLCATAAQAGTYAVGEVVVVEDTTGSIHNSMLLQSTFCQAAAKGLYTQFPDQYDGVVSFSTESLNAFQNVQQGTPVRQNTLGLGMTTWNNGGAYGSAAKLEQCVFMAGLPSLPNSPDGAATVLGGLPLGLTGVELLGHEYGHHWLLWVTFDKADGLGKRDLLRGYDPGNDPTVAGKANGHYSWYANSTSPMYGSVVTALGGGKFKLEGADRKYTELDQYLMGLRDKTEVGPMFALDDGSGHGKDSVPLAKGSSATAPQFGMATRVDLTIDDIIRSEGPRMPAFPSAQKCWRVAFVLVAGQGKTPTAAELAKVDAYRTRFEAWFRGATDNRGTMDTRLNGNGCLVPPPPDAGVVVPDAGQPDAGVIVVPDAGTPEVDAGMTMVEPDAGLPMDPVDAGRPPTKDETKVEPNNKLKPGCGCSTADVGLAVFALAGLLLRRRRS